MKKTVWIILCFISLEIQSSTSGITLHVPDIFQDHLTTHPKASLVVIKAKKASIELINAILDEKKDLAREKFTILYETLFQKVDNYMKLQPALQQAHEQDIISLLGITGTALHLYKDTFKKTNNISFEIHGRLHEYSTDNWLEMTLSAGFKRYNQFYNKAKKNYVEIITPTTWDTIKSSLKFSLRTIARYNLPGIYMYFAPDEVANQITADNEFYGGNSWPDWGSLIKDVSYYATNWFTKKADELQNPFAIDISPSVSLDHVLPERSEQEEKTDIQIEQERNERIQQERNAEIKRTQKEERATRRQEKREEARRNREEARQKRLFA